MITAITALTACNAGKVALDDTRKIVHDNASEVANDSVSNGNLIIYYAPESGNEALLKAAKKYGSEVIYVYRNINGIAVTVPANRTVQGAMKYYKKIKGVLSVVQDKMVQLD